MTIYAYGGPTYNNDNILPFDFKNVNDKNKKYLMGIPTLWNFKPFKFGEKNFE